MTDNTRFDAQVRGALTNLPMPEADQTREALRNVLERSGRTRLSPLARRPWMTTLMVAATVAVVALLTGLLSIWSPRSEPSLAAPPPASALVASWSREVTGAASGGWDGRWTMVLSGDGVLRLTAPATATASSEGGSYAVTPGRLRVDAFVNSVCDESPAGTYTWSVRGDTLTMTLVDDPCAARSALFVGGWVRSL